MAVRLGRAAGLRNASTAEFLFDEYRRFWFLEVNTRLQVEHGVTELAADVDLVREQLLVAAGRPLSERLLAASQAALRPTRHAIEVRLSAEDPGRDFAPAPGRVGRWRMPAGRASGSIPPSKPAIASHRTTTRLSRSCSSSTPTADAAIARLARALDEIEITGIQTTLPFHRFVAGHEGFRSGELSTGWVAEEWDQAAAGLREAALGIAAEAAARAAVVNSSTDPVDRGGRRASRLARRLAARCRATTASTGGQR